MLQPRVGAAAISRAALSVEQLARALGAELDLSRLQPLNPGSSQQEPSQQMDPAERAQLELAYAVQRLRPIDHVASLEQATPSSLVFVEDEAAVAMAARSQAGAILVAPAHAPALLTEQARSGGPTLAALLLTTQPRFHFAKAAQLLRTPDAQRGVHASAVVAPGVQLAARVSVGPLAVIEQGAVIGAGTSIGAGTVIGAGVVLGAECRIYPRVVIYPGTTLGDHVVVHAGAVLGSDGFGYVRDRETGAYLQFPQQGRLVIEDHVEIGANATVDRGALEETRLARGTKLDNLVHVGHNVQVGEDVVIAAQTGISGSSKVGRGAVIAGQVGIADHVTIGEEVILGAQCGVPSGKRLLGAGILFWGTPARPIRQYLRELATLARLTARSPGKPAADQGQ